MFANILRNYIKKTKSFINTNKIFHNSSKTIYEMLGVWCGVGLLVGVNGTIQEHDRIVKYNYNQEMISNRDKFISCLGDHIEAYYIYSIIFIYYPLLSLLSKNTYLEMIEFIRENTNWLHSRKCDILFTRK